MTQRIGKVGYVGPVVDEKQQKDSKEWPEFQDNHTKNLPVANWPRDQQLELEKERGIANKLRQKLSEKRYRLKHKAQRKKINQEYYKTHKPKFYVSNIIQRQKLTEPDKESKIKYNREYRKKNRNRINKQVLELYHKNKGKMKTQEPKQIKFIEVTGHKIPNGFTTIRIENLSKLQEALITLEVRPPVLFYGEGKFINILIAGLKAGHQLFFFHKDKVVYYAVEHKIKVLNGEVLKK